MPAIPRAILLVDDHTDTREMYALGLSVAGFRALTATDSASALDEIKRAPPDAVVVDLQLPGGHDGWDVIQAIKNDATTSRIPVVVLTARVEPSIPPHAQRVGCATVLTKPCLPEELVTVLQRVLAPDAFTGA